MVYVISESLLKRLTLFLRAISEIHDTNEYTGECLKDCRGCVAKKLLEDLGFETANTTW